MKKYLIMLLLILMPLNISAQNLEVGDNINSSGSYDSSKFIFGDNIEQSGIINGISVIFGNEINTKSETEYSIYAGNKLLIKDNVKNDLFIVGFNVEIDNSAILNRDVYILGSEINIKSNIKGNLKVAGANVNLSGIEVNDAYIIAENIILDENTIINGTFSYSDNTNIVGMDKAKIEKSNIVETYKHDKKQKIYQDGIKTIKSIFSGIIILFIILSFSKKLKEHILENDLSMNSLTKNCSYGILYLFGVPILSLFALSTVLLSSISIIILFLYGISIYICGLFFAYMLGNKICKLAGKDNFSLEIITGVIVYKLLSLVPIFGGLLSFIGLLYGLGIIVSLIQMKIKKV